MKHIGLDIGSTTIKCVVTDDNNKIIYSSYERHLSKVTEMTISLLEKVAKTYKDETMTLAVSGSAGMGVSSQYDLPFIQEVYSTRVAVNTFSPKTDVVIELGGEDAKILFLTGGFEMRMNGTCAGGTGAFIDQMAALMNIAAGDLNELAKNHEKTYTIASRCGVFAKSDVQPLLNQGAKKEDIAAGIFLAVANQTVSGLAQGRKISGNILYLGGPLTFLPELRNSFDKVLKVKGSCPENSLYYVALGAAMSTIRIDCNISELVTLMKNSTRTASYNSCAPLFKSEDEYKTFLTRHNAASENIKEIKTPDSEMCLGIDAGSTTIKILLCDKDGNIFRPVYLPNKGDPITIVKEYLKTLYKDFKNIKIRSTAVTGYGEEILKAAFHADYGLVETVAHFTAAKKYKPDVDFILDIGGQDIKCFKIANGVIDNIYLNEACSSGCGSFLQTFAGALGYTSEEFAQLGLFADAPVDLGSRCTVFMNSSVKQAQKDGASVENISAGLSISVVKNALYKVIRCANADDLGQNIVVQGGTFLNDAVLRAFEQEIDREVIRPNLAPLMGAYGAALYAWQRSTTDNKEASETSKELKSTILNKTHIEEFTHKTATATCNGCGNHCRLTINTFSDGGKYIAGNRCEKGINNNKEVETYNLFEYKLNELKKYCTNERHPGRHTIGIPLGLNMYELLPFWHAFWTSLGFDVIVSPISSRDLYISGQQTIPSDTICYPAKLMHGHIESLIKENPTAIFYPDMSYNIDESLGNNHFNCPVVAYYPQVLKNNISDLKYITFISDFIGLHDEKEFYTHIRKILKKYFPNLKAKDIKNACNMAYEEYNLHLSRIRNKANEFLSIAREKNLPVIALCGRPYHIDPEINHGIDKLICGMGAVVITEDSISNKVSAFPVGVMNQWTYHSRLYAAAKYVAQPHDDINIQLIQLVSFGCGVDAITTDETRSIIESSGKIYTQIKIDEISNMGAIKIRLRSLFANIMVQSH